MLDINNLKSDSVLLKKAKWLEGKTLKEISKAILKKDKSSRVVTKGEAGYIIENGFFGIKKNSEDEPDIKVLGIEIKSSPLKYNGARDKLSVKEPLSLNMINYFKEAGNTNLKQSSLYRKNRKILFVCYIHDRRKRRSDYIVKYVFLWKMTDEVLSELEPDYDRILAKIKAGEAEDIHQAQHRYLTLCPKHNGDFSDPNDKISKVKQPFSDAPAERRAFRFKTSYMNLIISRYLNKELHRGGWEA